VRERSVVTTVQPLAYARGSYAACLRAATVQPLAQLVAGDLATGEIGEGARPHLFL